MKEPLITIKTVVYKAEEILEKTILSVACQTYRNIEFIIIDGGSTDGTVGLINKHENQIKYWISEPDSGVYDAMNKGIRIATGNWIYFLGAGDVLENVIHLVVPQFTDQATLYYGDVYQLDKGLIYDGKFTAYKLAVRNICHQAIFYPSVVFTKYQYNLKYRVQADHALNVRCYGDKDIQFKYIPVTISTYEGDGLSANNLDLAFFEDKLQLVKANFPFMVYCYAYLRNKIAKSLSIGHFKYVKH